VVLAMRRAAATGDLLEASAAAEEA